MTDTATPSIASRRAAVRERVSALAAALPPMPAPLVEGRLTRMVGLTLEAVGCQVPVGDRCRIVSPGVAPFDAEVVGFDGDKIYLMPAERLHGVVPNARVIPLREHESFSVGEHLLGRIIDGAGRPLDGLPLEAQGESVSLQGESINPLHRPPISEPLDVGVRAINGLLTIGKGQRIGLFAGAGVGKSSLLGMMARHTQADVIVIGLIGERGREVVEFIDVSLGPEARQRAVVVAAPADDTPLMRLHGALLANSIAEYFRDQGQSVLLLMDSLTRFAQAQREIALAAGEMPATRGYPPSVFAQLPRLVERAGNRDNGGSITAFYTVLVEGDEVMDPVATEAVDFETSVQAVGEACQLAAPATRGAPDSAEDILERAKKHTQNAADALQRQQRMLHDAEHQRTQLGHFRDDYALQASQPGTSVSLARLMHLREFVENLDRALTN